MVTREQKMVHWLPRKLLGATRQASEDASLFDAKVLKCGAECCIFSYFDASGNKLAVRWCIWDQTRDHEKMVIEYMKTHIAPRYHSHFVFPMMNRGLRVHVPKCTVTRSKCTGNVTLIGSTMPLYKCDLYVYLTSACHPVAGVVKKALRRISFAMQLMHRIGLVHQDIRAQNVLLDERHVASLGDFGCTVGLNAPIACGLPGVTHPEGQDIALEENDIFALAVLTEACNISLAREPTA